MYFSGASHFLVRFDIDDCLCVVVRKHVMNPDNLNVGDNCQVKWNGSELLNATVIAMGDKHSMDKAEEDQLKCMYEEEEDDTEPPPPPPKKDKRSQCKDKPAGKVNKGCTPHSSHQEASCTHSKSKSSCVCTCVCVCVSCLCVYMNMCILPFYQSLFYQLEVERTDRTVHF